MSRRVAIVMFEGCQPLDVVGPFEVFAMANAVLAHTKSRRDGYEPLLVAPRAGLVRGESGLTLVAQASLSQLTSTRAKQLDTLLIAGGAGARRAAKEPKIQASVRRAAARAERLASVCTGTFVLAHAGLLHGKRVTTHWSHCAKLAKSFPEVEVESAPIYVRDGSVWTSAGVTAGIDLSLAMVEADLGSELAQHVARQLVVFIRRAGGQSQFSPLLSLDVVDESNLRELLAQVAERPRGPWSVGELARRAHLSVRHFSRVFRAETGCSPAEYIERVRIDAARKLLETSTRSVEQVAEACGFGTPESLRRAFARKSGLSPREYRARFSSLARPRARFDALRQAAQR